MSTLMRHMALGSVQAACSARFERVLWPITHVMHSFYAFSVCEGRLRWIAWWVFAQYLCGSTCIRTYVRYWKKNLTCYKKRRPFTLCLRPAETTLSFLEFHKIRRYWSCWNVYDFHTNIQYPHPDIKFTYTYTRAKSRGLHNSNVADVMHYVTQSFMALVCFLCFSCFLYTRTSVQ